MTTHIPRGPDAFVAHLAASIPPPLRGWADGAQLAAGAREFLAPLWTRLDDLALAESFFGHCPVAGAGAEDYRTRELGLTGFGRVWAGIRFKGGDMALPFVEVAADFALSAGAIAALRPLLSTAFAVFQPKSLRAWRFEPAGSPPWPDAELDQTYYVAPLTRVLAQKSPAAQPAMRVARAGNLDWYDAVAEAHAEFRATHPALADEVRFETRADLEACFEAGLLFEAHVDGTLAGVIAFDAEPFFGLPGYSVREEFLLGPFRGRGLGVWLQRLAAEQLSEGHVLFGTIHGLNTASRRTAEGNGRVPVLSSFFVRLPPTSPTR